MKAIEVMFRKTLNELLDRRVADPEDTSVLSVNLIVMLDYMWPGLDELQRAAIRAEFGPVLSGEDVRVIPDR